MTKWIARRWFEACTAVAVLGVTGSGAGAGAAERHVIDAAHLRDEHVQKAIEAIVDELHDRKQPRRFWEPPKTPTGESAQRGGYTALTVLALLYAGQTYQDPRLRGAVSYLEKLGMNGTYAVTVRASIWAKLPPRFEPRLVADTQWLIDGFSETAGGWNYRQEPNTTRRDNSITQYGALALWEAAKRGVNIDRRYWQMLEDRFLDMQLADGGWNYAGDGPATGSMTAAGLATLFITQDFLHADEFLTAGSTHDTRHQQGIDRGLEWMRANFSPRQNPGRDEYFFYYLHGVERVGLASGYKYLGSHDWYRQGAAEVTRRLCEWDPATRTMTVHQTIGGDGRAAVIRVRHLAFGLLFLSRGRVPVAINKLQDPSLAWNNRPRDVANLTRWIADDTETALNWQIVSLDAEPHEWLDAPVLYLASHQRLPWLDATARDRPESTELDKLKRYLDLGGMIFAVNEGSGRGFADSIEKAGRLMYPNYEWRTLRADHWAYSLHREVKAGRPTLRGLSNGVRELVVLSRASDFSATFQGRRTSRPSHYATAANVYFYASEMNRPRPRLARHFSAASVNENEPNGAGAADGFATIIHASHRGNWNPEPQALAVFGAVVAESGAGGAGGAVEIADHPLSAIDVLKRSPTLVVVNGIDAHDFTGPERKAIGAYVEAGGVILFETPGGRGDFTRSAEAVCTEIFGQPVRSLLRNRIITAEGLAGGVRLSRLDYRPFAFEVFSARETRPRLRAIFVNGQPRVLFSREDISHGLLDQPVWGVAGYSPESARNLLGNILLHAKLLREDG